MRQEVLPFILVLSTIIVVVLAVGSVFVNPPAVGHGPWQRFDLLTVNRDHCLADVRSVLIEAGENPLDRYSATVEIEGFSGPITIAVADLFERFEEDDPRLDPFVRALPSLFSGYREGKAVHVVYLDRSASSVAETGALYRYGRYRELSRALREFSFQLIGWEPAPVILSTVVALLVLLVLMGAAGRRWYTVLPALIPVGTYMFSGGAAEVVRGAVLAVSWALCTGRFQGFALEWLIYRQRPIMNRDQKSSALGLVAAVLVVLSTARGPALVSFLLFFASLASISVMLVVHMALRLTRADHRVFLPVWILSPENARGENYRRQVVLPLVVTVLVVAAYYPASLVLRHHDDLRLPVPEITRQNGAGAASVLDGARGISLEEYPLSTAGYLAHRRYQESLLYGGDFSVPALDESETMVRFVRDQGRVRDVREPMITFDRRWVEQQLSPSMNAAYRLLVAEGDLLTVTTRAFGSFPATGRNALRDGFGLFVLLVLSAFGPIVYSLCLPYKSRIGTVGRTTRRASQVV